MKSYPLYIALLTSCLTGCFSGSSSTPEVAPVPQVSAPSTTIFPHKSDWREPGQHGIHVKDILQFNTASCTGCHKEDADTTKGGAPSCRSCHAQFPHSDPGVTFDTHGDYVLKNGKTACATQCHGADLKGGLSGVACNQCHSTYPHADGWATPGAHGPAARGSLKNNCTSCHGSDWNGGKSKTSCLSCHKGSYPHPTGWSSPNQHGAFVLQNGSGKCATQCHGVQLDGGLSGKSCKEGCHTIWPHPATGWMAQHGQTARSVGLDGCTGCHQNDATGGKTGVTCTQCHASLPAHLDADWKTGGHGTLVMQQPTTLTDPKGCPLCHGAKLEGGKSPTLPGLKALKGCTSCHASYPALHKPAVGTPAWNTFGGHGKWIMTQVDASKGGVSTQINTMLSECKLCHGPDLTGGATGKSCYACHANFPHPPPNLGFTPWLSKHGAFANSETPKYASCASVNCHGKDLKGSPADATDVSKKWVKGCADCHLQMPHLPTGKWDHGKAVTIVGSNPALLDVNKCAQCHGSDWKGKGGAASCYTSGCHDTYPLPHRMSDGSKNPQWKTAAGHGFAVTTAAQGGTIKGKGVTSCTKCHGADLSGGASDVSCYACHKSFPHAPAPVTVAGVTYTFQDAAWNGAKGHGQYLTARATLLNVSTSQQIQSECATACHGVKSCLSCHHSKDHGAAATANVTPCKSCHGQDLTGGGAFAPGCTTCHGPGKSMHKTGIKESMCSDPDDPDALPWPCNQTVPYADPTLHGAQAKLLATTDPKTHMRPCRTCHGDDFNGGISGKACTSCHNPGMKYPHTKLGLATLDIWRNQIATNTVPAINAANFPGGDMLKNCYTTCHNWIVLKPDGKKVFEGKEWFCWSCHK